MAIEPINRDDGRHWCNPASADPEDSPVTCPDCGTEWEFDGVNVWSIVGEESAGEIPEREILEESAGEIDDPFDDLVFEESAGD